MYRTRNRKQLGRKRSGTEMGISILTATSHFRYRSWFPNLTSLAYNDVTDYGTSRYPSAPVGHISSLV